MTFIVSDDFQHMGIGSLLCQELIDYAQSKGIKKMRAKSFITNKGIRNVFDKQRDKFSSLTTYVDNEFIYFEFRFI
jgi:L-amino acid N-acyltransferase YncA